MISDNQYELVEKYVRGDLRDSEKASFEAELEENAELRKEVNIHRGIESLGQSTDVLAFKKMIEGFKEEEDIKILGLRPSIVYGLAAGFALLILGFFLWNNLKTNPIRNSQDLYQQYAELSSLEGLNGFQTRGERMSMLRGDATPIDSVLQEEKKTLHILLEADSLFSIKQFVAAEKTLNTLQQEGNPDYFSQAELSFNLGLLGMHLETWEKAVEHFSLVKGDLKNVADWYQALSLLKLERLAESRQIFERISQNTYHEKQELASQILSYPDIWNQED